MKDHDVHDGDPIGCCPPLAKEPCCDTLDFRYRLPHRVTVREGAGPTSVTVEVILHVRLTRCPGPLSLGDPVHTITLLPGEKVRLFTSDRHTRFTLDSTTNVSYRNEQLSEESYFMAAMQNSMSDLSVTDRSHSANSESGRWDAHSDATGSVGFLSTSVDTSANGSYSGQATADFVRQLSSHAQASANQSVRATHAAASLSVGEVATRSHTEGSSEDHFESSSREFSNPNRCHAMTFFSYRLMKKQTVKVTLEAIERRIDEAAAPTRVSLNPPVSGGHIAVVPTSVLATQKDRVAIEQIGRDSVAAKDRQTFDQAATGRALGMVNFAATAEPMPAAVRTAALKQVDDQLVAAGLLNAAGGSAAPEAKKIFAVTIESCLPTAGIIVKGCLDDCDVCEPELHQKIQLELEEQSLKNQLLKRQIELLDKAQEYRCCPPDEPPQEND